MPHRLHFDTARVRLARVSVSADHSLAEALHDTAAIAAEALAVGRVSVWRYVNGRQAIRCDFLYQPGQADVSSSGTILDLRELPMYARMLGLRRVVPVNDAQGDTIGDEFRGSYFEPLGITAMLDAPIYHQGHVTGIVCHEHLTTPRVWTGDEEELAGAVADTVARVYDEADLVAARHSLGTYRQQVEHLRHLTALGQMAAGMAHGFANVLMVADAHAEQLQAQAGEAQRADVQSILDANARGHRLVHALLRLARPSSLRPRVIDVSAVVENAAPMMRVAAGATVTLTLDLGVGLPRVLIDPAELERSLVNLVLNARDALPDGGTIHCRVFEAPRSAGAAPVVTIEVRDAGHGMDAATLTRAFEPFFTTKGEAGTGLGLAVVEQAIVMAGGSVDAESVQGAGTTIRLRLPAIAGPTALP